MAKRVILALWIRSIERVSSFLLRRSGLGLEVDHDFSGPVGIDAAGDEYANKALVSDDWVTCGTGVDNGPVGARRP